jgi:hypothetical protein
MFSTGPANNCYLDLFGAAVYGSINTLKGMENPRQLEVMLDVMLTATPASLTDCILFGKASTWAMDYDSPAAGVSAARTGMSFKVTRNAQVIATTNESPTLGKRITLWGRDNQSTVKAYSNGSVGATSITYTTAQASYAIATDANPILLGKSGANFTSMRLYEAAIRVNGVLVFHVRPRVWMQSGATPLVVPDTSGFGNDLTITGGALDTDFRYRSAWSKQMAYAGKETVG